MSDPVIKPGLVIVRFAQLHPPYCPGDNAAFDKATAIDLINRKIAMLASTSALERFGVTKSADHTSLEAPPAEADSNPSVAPVEAKPEEEKPEPVLPPSKPGPSVDRSQRHRRR